MILNLFVGVFCTVAAILCLITGIANTNWLLIWVGIMNVILATLNYAVFAVGIMLRW